MRGDALRSTLAEALGTARLTFDACQVPLGVSAFSLSTWRSVNLTAGDVLSALVASGAFPLLWAPLRLGPPTNALCTDFAAFADPAGIEALPSLPESGRLLHIAAGDWNLRRWLLKPPSQLPARLLARWRADGGGIRPEAASGGEQGERGGGTDALAEIEVVSLLLEGHTPVLPWGFQERGIRAMDGARRGLAHALDLPLEPGLEAGHWYGVLCPHHHHPRSLPPSRLPLHSSPGLSPLPRYRTPRCTRSSSLSLPCPAAPIPCAMLAPPSLTYPLPLTPTLCTQRQGLCGASATLDAVRAAAAAAAADAASPSRGRCPRFPPWRCCSFARLCVKNKTPEQWQGVRELGPRQRALGSS